MPLAVIGAGFCRTGTTSLTAALDKLGVGPCYHMRDNAAHGVSEAWMNVYKAVQAGEPLCKLKERLAAIWQKDEKIYQSTVDYPSQVFYKEMAAMYPNAKVVRSSAQPGQSKSACAGGGHDCWGTCAQCSISPQRDPVRASASSLLMGAKHAVAQLQTVHASAAHLRAM
jgi:Sulfotransferase domain